MSITSFYFLCLFALTLLLYYLVPKKVQWPLLLLLSIGYFLTSAEVRDSHAWYLILYPMAAVGAVWGAAILIDRTKEQKKKLAALICAVLFCVGLLCTLKFFHLGLLAPMGISFYTLTLLGYLFDVYYEIGPVQRNYGKLLLFGCYFPTMISGPIDRRLCACTNGDNGVAAWLDYTAASNQGRTSLRAVVLRTVPGHSDVCAVHEQGHTVYGRNAGSAGAAVQDAAWRMQQEGRS